MLVLSAAAFLIAVRMANALVRRLRRLRTNTLEVAGERLPSMVRRIGDGEEVDVDAELVRVDHGTDEIGQVAEAFETAQRTAVAAAAAEAKTRGGFNKVFLDIAHRSQVVVHRQLEVLDVAESKQGDPEHLELLFQLDHLATYARRNAENLLILGGGQAGRKWRTPVALEEIVRSAISETEDFARVSAVRLPDVKVLGNVVADLIHLLAELVDNATSFSPPDSPVTVRGNLVGKGTVVEVEDQGLGISFEDTGTSQRDTAQPAGLPVDGAGRAAAPRSVRDRPAGQTARDLGQPAGIGLRRDQGHRARPVLGHRARRRRTDHSRCHPGRRGAPGGTTRHDRASSRNPSGPRAAADPQG